MHRMHNGSRALVDNDGNAAGASIVSNVPQDASVQPTYFRLGDRVHIYEFGGPEVPKYLGLASVLETVDPQKATYRVILDCTEADCVAVVASCLQGDPRIVLRELTAHWGQRISTAFFGARPEGRKLTPADEDRVGAEALVSQKKQPTEGLAWSTAVSRVPVKVCVGRDK